MKTEIIKIKTNTRKNQYKKKSKDYIKYDACFKIAGLEICSENKIRESIVRTLFKNTVAVAVLCWYIKFAFTEFCQQIFEKKNVSESILEKIDKKILSHLADFGH